MVVDDSYDPDGMMELSCTSANPLNMTCLDHDRVMTLAQCDIVSRFWCELVPEKQLVRIHVYDRICGQNIITSVYERDILPCGCNHCLSIIVDDQCTFMWQRWKAGNQ